VFNVWYSTGLRLHTAVADTAETAADLPLPYTALYTATTSVPLRHREKVNDRLHTVSM
jgi:hypothetical protein